MRISIFLASLALGYGTLAQDIDCDGDVKVFNNKDAERLSGSCETISGSLHLGTGKGFSGDVVISGVERIRGDIDHSACNGSSDEDCDTGADDAKSWNLTMPDLTGLQGHLVINSRPNVLDYLTLPKLTTVRDHIDTNARHVDLNNLERMGGWNLDMSETKELRIKNLKGFTKDAPRGGIVTITGGAAEDDDDESILPNILTNRTLSSGSNDTWPQIKLEVGHRDLSESVAVAWDKIELLEVFPIQPEEEQDEEKTSPINLLLGGVDTGSMNITNFTLSGGVESFQRSENTVLNVMYFEVHSGYQWGNDIFFPDFTQLGQLLLHNMTTIEHMRLPETAADWGEYIFRMYTDCCRSLIMNQTDSEGRDMWYWPKSLSEKYITGCRAMDDEFRATAEDVAARIQGSAVDCANEGQNDDNEDDQEDEEDAALERSPITWVFFALTLPAVWNLLL